MSGRVTARRTGTTTTDDEPEVLMALFSRRRKAAADAATAEENAAVEATGTEDGPEGTAESGAAGTPANTAPDGPHDVADRPDLEGRLDLGALRVRLVEGCQVGFAMDDQRTVVHGVTLRGADSTLFVELFAAPRTAGVWDEVRAEILENLTQQGATADEMDGPFGREIVARQVVQRPDGSTERVPTRLIGVDGPRWFLRATASGRLAGLLGADRERHPLEHGLADLVVVRDAQARAPRTRIDLALPEGVGLARPGSPGAPVPPGARAPQRPGAPAVPSADEVLRRGPEITEVR